MVLRKALSLLLLVSMVSPAWGKKKVSSVKKVDPYEKAVSLSRQNKSEEALQILEKNFNLSNRELPLKVAQLSTNLAMNLKNWRKAERIADSALSSGWPGWPSLKTKSSAHLPLLKMSVEAKKEIFSASDGLSVEEQKRLKGEIKTYTDALILHGFEAPVAEAIRTEVQEQPVVKAEEVYKLSWSLAAAYWTWEDRPSFDYSIRGKATLFTPCFGVTANYTGASYIWSGGVCGGVGNASLQFSDGSFDNGGKVTTIGGFGSMLYRLSDNGAAFGVEGDFMNVTIKGETLNNGSVSATNQDFAAMAVGRFEFHSFEFRFKGGTVVAKPSAIWVVDISYPIF